jgi:UDP-glucose 4-epimerase
MTILLTGGAGYIGSIVLRRLLEKGHSVVVLDNLSKGHKESLPEGVPFYAVDIADEEKVREIIEKHSIDSVMHFAAYMEVGESVKFPEKYLDNNLRRGLVFLKTLKDYGVKKFVFSSTAAVYGTPTKVPIEEDDPKEPINPYGFTKLSFEKALQEYSESYDFNYVALRYFNASGAAYGVGEAHNPETHLIPLVLQVALGQRDNIKIFGTDYPTKDGTCVRDYIHVLDLADAHILALEHLEKVNTSNVFNLGSGDGYSVKEVIETCREVTGHVIPAEESSKREGDPAVLIADSSKIKAQLGWEAKFSLKEIVSSAWEWHREHPDGY